MDRDQPSTHFRQLLMMPPDLWELRIRLGAIESERHLQLLVETVDPKTHELLSAWSMHHLDLEHLDRALALLDLQAREAVRALREPF
jgi:hypothetical protein